MRTLNRLVAGLCAGAVILAAAPAVAAPFVFMNGTRELVTFADQATVRQEPNRRTVWTYTVPKAGIADGSAVLATKTEVDCAGERFRDIYGVTYAWSGNAVTTKNVVEQWQTVVPDTFGVRLLNLVCRGKADRLLGGGMTFLDVARAAQIALQDER